MLLDEPEWGTHRYINPGSNAQRSYRLERFSSATSLEN
jgi:hypothetical protein